MALIIVMTNKNNSNLADVMSRALEKNGGVKEIKRAADIRKSRRYKNCMLKLKNPFGHRFKNSVTVFDSSYKGTADSGGGTNVFASSCKNILASMANGDCIGISCGTGPLDTLSVASCNEGRMLISVQREIKTLSGNIIEPCEIIVKTERLPHIYPTLAACAALLISGVPYENGYEM